MPSDQKRGFCPAAPLRSPCLSPWGMESVRLRGHFFFQNLHSSLGPGILCSSGTELSSKAALGLSSHLIPRPSAVQGRAVRGGGGDVGGGCTCRCGAHVRCVRPSGAGCHLTWEGVYWEPGARGWTPPWHHILTGSFKDTPGILHFSLALWVASRAYLFR